MNFERGLVIDLVNQSVRSPVGNRSHFRGFKWREGRHENGWMVYRHVGRLMQQGMERPWEQRPSTLGPKEQRKLLLWPLTERPELWRRGCYWTCRHGESQLLPKRQWWGREGAGQNCPTSLLSFLTQQGSLSEESSGVCLWRQSKVGRQAQLGSGGNISGQVESKQHTLIPRGVAGEGTQVAVWNNWPASSLSGDDSNGPHLK